MPYIKEENRGQLDGCINDIIQRLMGNVAPNKDNPYSNPYKDKLTNEEFMTICGDINYTFSRILGSIMGDVSYPKIALITGVLENIKQEYYRRVAESYEDLKIKQNGDIPEYKRTNL